ncbi:MAG: hypothetical protein ACOZHQ_02515 [Thermodesulfobacteriota bacterium]
MSADARSYLTCPQRPGSPRVAEAVCRSCRRARRCPAWQAFRHPPLFPGFTDPARSRGRA